MNATQRQIILARDAKCIHCGSTKQPTVQHVYGRATKWEGAPDERYHMVVRLCNPCHQLCDRGSSASDEVMVKKREIKARQEEYAAQWEGKEPPEYVAAYAQERVDYEKREARKKVARSKANAKTTEKLGGSKLKRDYQQAKAKKERGASKWAGLPGAPVQRRP